MGLEVESEEDKARRLAIVDAFAVIVKEKRKDAIQGRKASGIETEWAEDEAHYEGYDDASKRRPTMLKGRGLTDGVTEQKSDPGTRSTVFLKITRPYCDAAAARFSDMVLPSDDRNWAIKPTPKPDLVKMLQDSAPAPQPGMMAQQQMGDMPPMGQPGMPPAGMPPQQPTGLRKMIGSLFGSQGEAPPPANMPAGPTVAEVAQQAIDKAKASAERAQEQIDDWHVECRYHAEVRRVLESSARVGTGVLKGPHPGKTRKRAAVQTPNGWAVQISEEVKPQSKFVNVWNFYPDPSCGEDIQRGSYVFEADDITARKLLDLKGGDYLDDMIDACIDEGPISSTDGTRKNAKDQKTAEKDLYQIWYFHGMVSKKDMEAAGCECGEKDMYPCIVTMVNDRIIKIAMSPLDCGEFPYDVMVWQERIGHWAGVGVARQMRECQKGANAAVRNLMDNAGLSAGPQIIINRDKIRPANGKWEITPRKLWLTVTGEEVSDVSQAFMIVNIQTLQQELMAILQFWLAKAEDVTGLPMLLQGQQGKAPDTVGATQILNNNGTTVLRRIARNFDDRVTEPHIGRYYEFLMIHGPDDAKGDFTIDARGSSALVERDAQKQELMQLIGLSTNPAFGMDPELVIAEVIKSMRFDPKRMVLSDEKKQAAAQQPPPPIPQVEAAKVRGAIDLQKTDKVLADKDRDRMVELKIAQVDTDRDTAYVNAEAQKNAQDDAREWKKLELLERIEMLKLANDKGMTLDQIKADLAGLAIKSNLQRELAHVSAATQVLKPPVEPRGRAPAGQAYQK